MTHQEFLDALESADAELVRLREIERLAAGVVRTSDPRTIYQAVVPTWRDALKNAVKG